MMVQLFEGCFGLTRGGDGVPQEVVGPMRKDPEYTYMWDCEECYQNSGVYHWTGDGERGFAANRDCPSIIATFPDRTSAEAALAGGEPLPGGDEIDDIIRKTCDDIDAIFANGRMTGGPRPAEPAQAGVDWDAVRAKMLAVEDAINEPPKLWADEPLEVREYRHHLYRIWSPLCSALIAAAKGGQQ